jgi:hypothetical protein
VNRLSRLTLVFSITFAVLIISPAFLNRQFGPYPLMKTGDVIDLFTPLILIPLYWLLFSWFCPHFGWRAKGCIYPPTLLATY